MVDAALVVIIVSGWSSWEILVLLYAATNECERPIAVSVTVRMAFRIE